MGGEFPIHHTCTLSKCSTCICVHTCTHTHTHTHSASMHASQFVRSGLFSQARSHIVLCNLGVLEIMVRYIGSYCVRRKHLECTVSTVV